MLIHIPALFVISTTFALRIFNAYQPKYFFIFYFITGVRKKLTGIL